MRRSDAVAITSLEIARHQRAALCQHLKSVPMRRLHSFEHGIDEVFGYLLVKKVAHRIDEDAPWPPPAKRLRQTFGSEREIKAIFKRMPSDTAETL